MLRKKQMSKSLAITEMQITWIRYHYMPIRLTKITELDDKSIIWGGE